MDLTMKKTILALCMVLIIFVSSTITSFATCPNPNSEGGAHDFSGCKNVGGIVKDLGYHQYLYGYDEYHSPIYRSCHLTQAVEYGVYVCVHCGLENTGSSHTHIHDTKHSAEHN